RCLRKDPARRLRDIADARLELEDMLAAPPAETTAIRRPVTWRSKVAFALIGATAASVLIAGYLTLRRVSAPPPRHATKLTFTPKELLRGSFIDIDAEVSISHDGKHIAYVEEDGGQFWLRDIDQEQPRPVPGAKDVYQAFWSPDNQFVGYAAGLDL